MDKANYTDCLGALFPHPNRPEIYNKLIADGATGVIFAKAKAIHCARIADWDTFKAVEREAWSFIIDAFDEAWYSKLCEAFTFYARVMTRQMLEYLQCICVGNHAIEILDLQDKMRVMHTEHD